MLLMQESHEVGTYDHLGVAIVVLLRSVKTADGVASGCSSSIPDPRTPVACTTTKLTDQCGHAEICQMNY